mmetsp:Transcript_29038/g.83317  ORF Transcript_29038/g.83317 Transcript_29038/m.83317 type:complete len:341 (-) Transcript_29038:599-1621(-)
MELPGGVDRCQHALGELVDGLVGHVAEILEVIFRRHLYVQAAFCRLGTAVHSAPVRDNETLEVQILAKQLGQQLVVFASIVSVDLVVRAHDSAGAGLYRRFERREIDLMLCAIAHDDIDLLTVLLLFVVEPMLRSRDDAMAVNLSHVCRPELAAKVRIFAGQALESPPAKRCADDLHIGAQEHPATLREKLLRDGLTEELGNVGVEAGSNGDQVGILSALAGGRGRVAVVSLRAVVHRDVKVAPVGALQTARLDHAGEAQAPWIAMEKRLFVCPRHLRNHLLGALLRNFPLAGDVCGHVASALLGLDHNSGAAAPAGVAAIAVCTSVASIVSVRRLLASR